MSPLEDSNSYITTATGGIDFAYYEKRARIERAEAFGDMTYALKGIFSKPRQRLSIAAPALGSEPVASPCG